jgi:cobalt-zinc-cadmium efflux system outer membrane protein
MSKVRNDAGAKMTKPPAFPALVFVFVVASAQAASVQDDRIEAEFRGRVQMLLRATLTAGRAVQIALLNNQNLQSTFEEIGVARADLVEAGLLKNPTLDARVRFPDEGSGTNNEVDVAFDLIDAFKVPLRRKIAASEVVRAQFRASDAILKLATEVKTAFYSLQAKQHLAARAAEINRTNAASLDLHQRQHEAGNISDLELAGEQVAYSQAKLEAIALAAEIRSERERLNRLMGLWGSATQWNAAERLPEIPQQPLPVERLETLAIEQRRDLAASKAEITGLVQSLGLTKTYRFVPDLELGVSTEEEPDGPRVTGPSVRLELPVFNQAQGRILKVRAQLRQAERRMEAEAIEIRSEVRETRDRMLAKQDLARFYRDEMIPERKRVLDLTLTHYNAMLKGPYDLLLAKQNEIAAERGYIEALRDYWIARTELERAVGGSLTNRVRTSLESFKETKTRE